MQIRLRTKERVVKIFILADMKHFLYTLSKGRGFCPVLYFVNQVMILWVMSKIKLTRLRIKTTIASMYSLSFLFGFMSSPPYIIIVHESVYNVNRKERKNENIL